ncbi:hypothetical protein [Negadavirga shengliensis]|uniref:Uncharacterized protein n=1 Tax=Negadavirga shengliensis TaxID=1389218 RepID=A0ABV9T481_9BACT
MTKAVQLFDNTEGFNQFNSVHAGTADGSEGVRALRGEAYFCLVPIAIGMGTRLDQAKSTEEE